MMPDKVIYCINKEFTHHCLATGDFNFLPWVFHHDEVCTGLHGSSTRMWSPLHSYRNIFQLRMIISHSVCGYQFYRLVYQTKKGHFHTDQFPCLWDPVSSRTEMYWTKLCTFRTWTNNWLRSNLITLNYKTDLWNMSSAKKKSSN